MNNCIIVVDDSELDCMVIKKLINVTLPARDVICFQSGAKALQHLQSLGSDSSKFPSMLLLDIYMPEMDGFTFLERFSHFSGHVHDQCTTIVISHTNDKQDHERIRSYPIVRKFIPKPLSFAKIGELKELV